MALFKRRSDPSATVAAQLAELDRRLAAAQFENSDLQARLAALESRPLPRPVLVSPDPEDLTAKVRALLGDPPPAIDPRRIEALEAARDRFEMRLAELGSVVTNQLGELSSELDGANARTAERMTELEREIAALAESAPTVPDEADRLSGEELEELRANQVRIANELARFSIAVREEMAALAPRVALSARH
jgi:hypothetical protein